MYRAHLISKSGSLSLEAAIFICLHLSKKKQGKVRLDTQCTALVMGDHKETILTRLNLKPHGPYHANNYAALLLKEGAAYCVALCLSVRLSVRPVIVFVYFFTVEPSYERTSKIEKLLFSLMGQRHVFTARTEGRISYGHVGRTHLLQLRPTNLITFNCLRFHRHWLTEWRNDGFCVSVVELQNSCTQAKLIALFLSQRMRVQRQITSFKLIFFTISPAEWDETNPSLRMLINVESSIYYTDINT